jgi:predicted nuclease of predicted toxin-antitoxin system
MKFLADMGISPEAVRFLTSRGHDAIHLHDEGLDRENDPEILEKAKREGCILLTHDLDFGDLVAASGDALPSVITFRLRNMKPANVNRYLKEIIIQHKEALDRGAFVSVTEGKLRVRLLPMTTRE